MTKLNNGIRELTMDELECVSGAASWSVMGVSFSVTQTACGVSGTIALKDGSSISYPAYCDPTKA
jgi:hypothetical protein